MLSILGITHNLARDHSPGPCYLIRLVSWECSTSMQDVFGLVPGLPGTISPLVVTRDAKTPNVLAGNSAVSHYGTYDWPCTRMAAV